MRTARGLVACLLLLAVAGCTGDTVEPRDLPDPCPLIADDMLTRLAPGADREPAENLGDQSGSRECAVDLTAGNGFRGDLLVRVEAESRNVFDDERRSGLCAEIDAPLGFDASGTASCVAVRPFDGAEARFDGWAFAGEHHAARVAYQLIEPQEFPAGAEQDLRALLADAAAGLPAE